MDISKSEAQADNIAVDGRQVSETARKASGRGAGILRPGRHDGPVLLVYGLTGTSVPAASASPSRDSHPAGAALRCLLSPSGI